MNVNAFSTGFGPPATLPILGPASFIFSVDPFATGDPLSVAPPCTPPPVFGPFPPDVMSEAGLQPGSTDAPADVFVTVGGPAAPLPAGFSAPGTQPHTATSPVTFDGDGSAAPPFFFAPAPPLGLVEPFPGGDDVDAFDSAPIGVIDLVGPDGIPDVHVYFSVDPPTATALSVSPGDILTTVSGLAPSVYAPAFALGLLAGDDVDALYVTDVGAPATFGIGSDVVLFSLAPGSPTIGAPDCCSTLPINEGDILVDPGAAFATGSFPGCTFGGPPPCILSFSENSDLWSARLGCGPNAAGASNDNVDALDLTAPVPPPATPIPTIPPSTPTPGPGTPTPGATATPGVTCTPPAPLPTVTPLGKDAIKCQRTIAKEASKFAKAKTKALQKCHEALLKDKFGAGADLGPGGGVRRTFCRSESKTQAKIAKAESKILAGIAKKCGGSTKTCDGDPNDPTPDDLGFYATCPDFEASGESECTATLSDCDDLGKCVRCIAEQAIDQAVLLYYDSLSDVDPTLFKDLHKCQLTLGKETAKFLLQKEKNLAKCWDQALKGKPIGSTTCPDHTAAAGTAARKAAEKIAKAESKKIAKICKKCGGPDKQCDNVVSPLAPLGAPQGGTGSGDDFTRVEIGFPATCDAVKVPKGGPLCGGSVSTLADIVRCLDCVTEFKVDCIDAARMPELQGRVYPCECR